MQDSDESRGTATLFLRYMDGVTEVFVHWDAVHFASDSVQFHHTIDGGQPTLAEWPVSTTGSSTFYPGNHVQFIKRLVGASTLVIATELDGKAAGAFFDVGGIEQVIGPLHDVGGFWHVSQQTDPFDDSVVTIAAVDSDDQIEGDHPSLVLRNSTQGHEAYIIWGLDIGYDEPVEVRYRIGRQPSEFDEWNISTDRQATFYLGDVRRLIGRLADADRLLARVTPYRSNPITASFDLRGLPAIVELLE